MADDDNATDLTKAYDKHPNVTKSRDKNEENLAKIDFEFWPLNKSEIIHLHKSNVQKTTSVDKTPLTLFPVASNVLADSILQEPQMLPKGSSFSSFVCLHNYDNDNIYCTLLLLISSTC